MGCQRALHKENNGFAALTPGRHISTYPGRWFAYIIVIFRMNIAFMFHVSPIIFLFIHNHLTLRKWCYTRLLYNFPLDPLILPFHFHFRTYKRDLAILTLLTIHRHFTFTFKHLSCDFEKTTITTMYHGRWFAYMIVISRMIIAETCMQIIWRAALSSSHHAMRCCHHSVSIAFVGSKVKWRNERVQGKIVQ
jgi:hypothetical protein